MSRYHWSIPRYRNRFSRIYTCYRCSWQAHDAVVHVVASFGTKWFICRRCAVQKNAGKVAGRPKEPQERKYQWVFIRLIFAFFAGITHVMVPKRGVGRATPLGNGCILCTTILGKNGVVHPSFKKTPRRNQNTQLRK